LRLAPSRQPHVRGSTIGAFAVLLVVAIAVQGVRFGPASFRYVVASLLAVLTLASIAVIAAMLILALAAVAVMTRLPDWHETSATEEEPLVPPPAAPRTRGRSPLIGFVDLEPSAGASSLAFNLAVLAAVEGRSPTGTYGMTRRPRPLCLLSEGQLTEALRLESDPWRVHLDANSGRVVEDLVDLAVRHPSGCELLCVPRGHVARHQLRLLRLALDRHYDLVVLDCSTIDADLREGAEDTADVLVAVGLASPRSADAAFDMLSETCRRGRLATTVLLLNQIRERDSLLDELPSFDNVAVLPQEHIVAEANSRGLPWSLMASCASGRVLRELGARLLPDLLTGADHAIGA
jgi:hypothetical protein